MQPYRQELYEELERKVRHWAIVKDALLIAPQYNIEAEQAEFMKLTNNLNNIFTKIKSSAFHELKQRKNVEFFLDDDDYTRDSIINDRTIITYNAYINQPMFGLDLYSRTGKTFTFKEAKGILYDFFEAENWKGLAVTKSDYIDENLSLHYLYYSHDGKLVSSPTKPTDGEYVTVWGLYTA